MSSLLSLVAVLHTERAASTDLKALPYSHITEHDKSLCSLENQLHQRKLYKRQDVRKSVADEVKEKAMPVRLK